MYNKTTTRKPGTFSSRAWPIFIRQRPRIFLQAFVIVFGVLFVMGIQVVLAQEQMGSDFTLSGVSSGLATSLSTDGTVLAIGDHELITGGGLPGYVQVFEWNGSDWQQRGSDIIGESIDSGTGSSVSLSSDGQIVAIGANKATRVHAWNGSDWVQRGSAIDGSSFSVSLSADGSAVAIGDTGGPERIFDWDGDEWKQRGDGIPEERTGDRASRVCLSSNGMVVAIGAPWNNPNTSNLFNAGHVRAFEWNGEAWTQRGNDIDGKAITERSGSGVSLSFDADALAVWADNGPSRLYDWNGDTWVQRGDDIGDVGQQTSLSSDAKFMLNGGRLYEWKDSDWVEIGSIPGVESARYILSSDASVVAKSVGRIRGSSKLVQVYRTGAKVVANEQSDDLPEQYALTHAYPNPFNPSTTFSLTLERTQPVRVSVVDLLGREVALLHEGVLAAGASQTFAFEAGRLHSGHYLIRVVGEGFVASRSVVLVK